MTRHVDWENRLSKVVEFHRTAPAQWGVSDCWMLAVDTHEAVTGRDLMPRLRGYGDERSGYKLFAKHGFKTVEAALASQLSEKPVFSAMRGDIATVERNDVIACAIVTASGLMVRTLSGVEFLPLGDARKVFEVI